MKGKAFFRAAVLAAACLAVSPAAAAPIVFEDVTAASGLAGMLGDWQLGHGAAWGDVTGNGRPDLYIGAFADRPFYAEADAPLPNMLFLNEPGGFTLAPGEAITFDARGRPQDERARTAMALFADLDNSGRLDLLVGNFASRRNLPSRLFRNLGGADFADVTPRGGDWPERLDTRNIAAVDLDRDGRLDLVVVDGRYRREPRPLLALRNRGDFTFEDISARIGFPAEEAYGLGLAIGDVNDDGWPDFFVAHSNRLLVSRGDGTWREYRPGFFREPEFYEQPFNFPRDGWPCGAAFADMTGNGLLDLVFTVHGVPARIFLYLNRGLDGDGWPVFENVSAAAGLDLVWPRRGAPLPGRPGDDGARVDLRAAHLVLADLNNNGRRDILLSMVRLAEDGRVQPVVLRHEGVGADGVPRFSAPPTESILGYYATAPAADYDRDGRIDIFMARWHDQLANHLFRNVTAAGNFLVVGVRGNAPDLNPMGVGAVVRLYEAGRAGDPAALLGRGDIVLGSGYSCGEEALVHFGLGRVRRCDVVVDWQGHRVLRPAVAVNRYLAVDVPAPQELPAPRSAAGRGGLSRLADPLSAAPAAGAVVWSR